jgi:DMSO/TMAO reductase YedYZ molybdopterin-dependent catalytic subunit
VGFFDRNRRQLEERGIDPRRLPPGQYFTERFPVLHVGDIPTYDLSTWDLRVSGLVGHELVLTWDELLALPAVEVTTDIHCVTKWSKFDTVWKGVPVRELFDRAGGVREGATHVIAHAEFGYTANLPLDEVLHDDDLVAYEFDGAPLEPQHGYPLRLFVPRLYFWKSAKWLRGLEVVAGDRPGFWERNGYHNEGDPWREQRYWGD